LVSITSNAESTIIGLGSAGYVSTSFLLNDIASTIQGLGSELYISSSGVQSTIQGLGTIGYISSFNTDIACINIYASTLYACTIVSPFVLQVQLYKFT
jgi:hypothetical protein